MHAYMDTPNTIVIVGGLNDNQAKLQTQLKPVKIEKNLGLAITSIFHGEVYNINKNNNTVRFYVPKLDEVYSVTVPIGHYSSTIDVLRAISDSFKRRGWVGISQFKKPRLDMILHKGLLQVSVHNMNISTSDEHGTPWRMLGLEVVLNSEEQVTVKNINFNLNLEPAFLYVNIVENSYINGKMSRVLNLLPISLKAHCSYYEFAQPNFVPIDVKEFSKIMLEIRNMDGEFVPFEPKFKTIITLQTKQL